MTYFWWANNRLHSFLPLSFPYKNTLFHEKGEREGILAWTFILLSRWRYLSNLSISPFPPVSSSQSGNVMVTCCLTQFVCVQPVMAVVFILQDRQACRFWLPDSACLLCWCTERNSSSSGALSLSLFPNMRQPTRGKGPVSRNRRIKFVTKECLQAAV